MKVITPEEAQRLGAEVAHHEMMNGEKRFRLVHKDGSSYIRTEASCKGAWQNSHYHEHLSEIYIVEKGWILFAELSDHGELKVSYLNKGDIVNVKPLKRHNIYMSAFSVTHVVKYLNAADQEIDWIAAPALDELTKGITEDDMLGFMGK